MADSSPSFFRRHWEGWKDYWGERFAILDNYAKFVNRDKPLPKWSDSDVEEFIASDPVYGPTLRTTREAAKFAVAGAVIGAVSTAAVSWKYSRSPHGKFPSSFPMLVHKYQENSILFFVIFIIFDLLPFLLCFCMCEFEFWT
ncbi:hypothetical protein PVL29_009030 [Vitis rotundifolia]|uniref:Uncharacterized protein n=1 Tax=Vitis rotundifolia TaxID=103349 RepID=A0AA39DU66_VITRO|nr:hypothetical protein PVL29_009030 [Vitis rotundifolia]